MNKIHNLLNLLLKNRVSKSNQPKNPQILTIQRIMIEDSTTNSRVKFKYLNNNIFMKKWMIDIEIIYMISLYYIILLRRLNNVSNLCNLITDIY